MRLRLRPQSSCWAFLPRNSQTTCRPQYIRPFSVSSSRSDTPRRPLDIPPPFPVTQTCPEPSCSCAPTPPMPEGLEIDHEQPLNGTMAAYTQQLLICTGQGDWASRIEDDGKGKAWGALSKGLRKLMGRRGRYADPYNNVLVTAASFPAPTSPSTASAFLFPSFKFLPSIPVETPSLGAPLHAQAKFVRAFLLPTKLHEMHSALPEEIRAELTRSPELQSEFPGVVDIKRSPTILICSHGGRDMRCGVMGPVLEAEFHRVLREKGYTSTQTDGSTVDGPNHANVGLVSHIGGHKYAGNVIIYIPPGLTGPDGAVSPLAGKGIWYGRIEPKHVEGVVEETILKGRVITDHFRGGIDRDGTMLRL